MNKMLVALAATGMVVATTGSAMAAPQAQPRVIEQAQVPQPGGVDLIAMMKQGKSLETVSCRDFAAIDASFQPEAVKYAIIQGKHGKDKVDETVTGLERITPAVLGECQARPGDHFTAVVKKAVARNR